MNFPKCDFFWQGVVLDVLTTDPTPKATLLVILLFLTVSGTIKMIKTMLVLLTCCVFCVLQHTFLISENAVLKWQNHRENFTVTGISPRPIQLALKHQTESSYMAAITLKHSHARKQEGCEATVT